MLAKLQAMLPFLFILLLAVLRVLAVAGDVFCLSALLPARLLLFVAFAACCGRGCSPYCNWCCKIVSCFWLLLVWVLVAVVVAILLLLAVVGVCAPCVFVTAGVFGVGAVVAGGVGGGGVVVIVCCCCRCRKDCRNRCGC